MWNCYLVGQCTWGVKEITLWGSNWWCNGGDWAGSTASQGYAVGSISAARSIVCWTGGGYQIRWFCYTSWLDSNLGVEL